MIALHTFHSSMKFSKATFAACKSVPAPPEAEHEHSTYSRKTKKKKSELSVMTYCIK